MAHPIRIAAMHSAFHASSSKSVDTTQATPRRADRWALRYPSGMDVKAIFDPLGSATPGSLIEQVAELAGSRGVSDVRNAEGTTLLLACVFVGRGDLVEALLQHFPDVSLHDAAAAGATRRIAELIAAETDALDLLSPDGWTALHLAAHMGHAEIVSLLLEAGADPTVHSRAFERNLPLHAALAGRADACVKLLARATPELDVRVGEGFTALMEAAYQGLATSVELLLELGADAALRNDAGQSPLDLAREAKHAKVVALLEAR